MAVAGGYLKIIHLFLKATKTIREAIVKKQKNSNTELLKIAYVDVFFNKSCFLLTFSFPYEWSSYIWWSIFHKVCHNASSELRILHFNSFDGCLEPKTMYAAFIIQGHCFLADKMLHKSQPFSLPFLMFLCFDLKRAVGKTRRFYLVKWSLIWTHYHLAHLGFWRVHILGPLNPFPHASAWSQELHHSFQWLLFLQPI